VHVYSHRLEVIGHGYVIKDLRKKKLKLISSINGLSQVT
jgi:hypothetical protein